MVDQYPKYELELLLGVQFRQICVLSATLEKLGNEAYVFRNGFHMKILRWILAITLVGIASIAAASDGLIAAKSSRDVAATAPAWKNVRALKILLL